MTRRKDREKADKAAKGEKPPKDRKKSGGDGAGRSLTVAYGAFTCTLKGYDDPVAIVQTLTEHFRALTSAEPRFALAPPPLDMAMLQQIAEAELRRQVEAGVIDAATIVDLARASPEEDASQRPPRPEPEDAELADPAEGAGQPATTDANVATAPESGAAQAEALRKSRRAQVIAQLRAAVEQATAEHRRAAASRTADASPQPSAASARQGAAAPTPAPGAADAKPDVTPAATGTALPRLRLGPALRLDGEAPAPRAGLPSAPSAQVRAYPPFAQAQDMDARMRATARYLTEVEGRVSFDAAHAVALLHANTPEGDASACRAAFERMVSAGALLRLSPGRFGLSPPAA